MIPKIVGVIATAGDGTICYGTRDEHVIGEAYHKSYRDLDFQILKKVIDDHRDAAVFVLGENTLDHMGKILDGQSLVVSSKDSGTHELVAESLASAMKNGHNTVVVLGGRSVYNAFKQHYDVLYHTTFQGYPDAIYGDKKLVQTKHLLDNSSTYEKDALVKLPGITIEKYWRLL